MVFDGLAVVLVVISIVGGWWMLSRVLNGDQTPEAGGSFGDQVLGEKNRRKRRKARKRQKPT